MIPLRGKVFELTEEYSEESYDGKHIRYYPVGSRFKVNSIRLTTQNNYIKISFPAVTNKYSPLHKDRKGDIVTLETEEFNEVIKYVEVTDGK